MPSLGPKPTPASRHHRPTVPQLALQWKPRVKKAEEITATVFARSTSLVTFQRGLMRTRTQVDYQITQGEPAPPALPCPQDTSSCVYRPRECGPWRILTANPSEHRPHQTCRAGVSNRGGIGANTAHAAGCPVTLPRVLEVKRDQGLVALQSGDDLSVTAAQMTGLTKRNLGEFSRVMKLTGQTAGVYGYPINSLSTQVEAVQPQLEAVAAHHLVGSEQHRLSSTINYTIKTGLFSSPSPYRKVGKLKVHGAHLSQTNLIEGG